jgi:formylglycine-generating enzyme required for sulfatase activity
VGRFPSNSWGLHDMHGNLWEWCEDRYAEYLQGEAVDPQGPPAGDSRVLRGGAFGNQAMVVRSANRLRGEPTFRDYDVGCRVAMTITP